MTKPKPVKALAVSASKRRTSVTHHAYNQEVLFRVSVSHLRRIASELKRKLELKLTPKRKLVYSSLIFGLYNAYRQHLRHAATGTTRFSEATTGSVLVFNGVPESNQSICRPCAVRKGALSVQIRCATHG